MLNYSKTSISIGLDDVKSNEEIVVSKKKKLNLPMWQAWGNGEKSQNGVKSMDMVRVLLDLNSNEKKCFTKVYDTIMESLHFEVSDNLNAVPRWDFVAKVNNSDKMFQKKFLDGFKGLKEKKIMVRVKRGHYMISPMLLIAANGQQLDNENTWDSID